MDIQQKTNNIRNEIKQQLEHDFLFYRELIKQIDAESELYHRQMTLLNSIRDYIKSVDDFKDKEVFDYLGNDINHYTLIRMLEESELSQCITKENGDTFITIRDENMELTHLKIDKTMPILEIIDKMKDQVFKEHTLKQHQRETLTQYHNLLMKVQLDGGQKTWDKNK